MKKWVIFALCVCLALSVTACSQHNNVKEPMTLQDQVPASVSEQSGPVDNSYNELSPENDPKTTSSNAFEQINSAIGKIDGFGEMPDDCLLDNM